MEFPIKHKSTENNSNTIQGILLTAESASSAFFHHINDSCTETHNFILFFSHIHNSYLLILIFIVHLILLS